jgi:DNA-binding transcriptional ArsR family regulator
VSTKIKSAEGRLIKAMAHPLRFRLLILLNERAASPSGLASMVGEPVGNVSYHVRILAELGAAELVETRQVRGAVEHIYRATARPFFDDAHWAKLPVSVRRQFQDQTIQGIWEHLVEAAAAEGLDRPDTHVSWTTLDLDEQGFEDVTALLAKTLDRALEINAEVAGRAANGQSSGVATQRTELAILHYQRPGVPQV